MHDKHDKNYVWRDFKPLLKLERDYSLAGERFLKHFWHSLLISNRDVLQT